MKSVFITGGTTGIGWELANLYLKSGWRVGVCGRDLGKLPGGALDSDPFLLGYTLDVTDQEKVRETINEFAKDGLDVVIANAGISHGSKSSWPEEKVTRQIMEINLMGTLNAFFPALDIFKEKKAGHIVAIASVAGFVGLPGASAYSSSKGALIHLMESYALHLPSVYNIDVTTICPGFIDTPLTQKNDHSMPFLMPAPKGARLIKAAIDQKKVLFVFPWQMALVIHILRRIPRALYRWIMKLPLFNYSK
ncbi:MAG: SDR family NAD(P)-dependent oxidoreductase [Bdellovibrionota bacterium]|jgi:NAD(P)-dependent dehydrogenase (short-subunit alcohol dehydrogenase family)|nr:SDR family NAD(P)-dependent oxidoreductase [Bdellovibrionota bacterium]